MTAGIWTTNELIDAALERIILSPVSQKPGPAARELNIARTHLEDARMRVNRAYSIATDQLVDTDVEKSYLALSG